MNIPDWASAPEVPELVPNELHVWRAPLSPTIDQLDSFGDVLSSDESVRRARFRFEEHRQSWSASRTVLRHVISQYIRVPPGEIRFDYNKYGKPELRRDQNHLDLCSNTSYSSKIMVCAISSGMRVGVDIERVRDLDDLDRLADRVFSATALRSLHELPHDQKIRAFFNCWTRKEAYSKALGLGLSLPPDSFDVTFRLEEPPRITRVSNPSVDLSGWLLADLPLDEQFAGAVAVEGLPSRIRSWLWDWDRIPN